MTLLGRTVARHLERRLGGLATPLTVRLWDDATVHLGRPGPAPCTVSLRSPRVAWRLLTRPGALTVGEAFLDGLIDVEGDVFAAMRAAHGLARPGRRRHRRRTRRQARRAARFHYDVSNDFYALFLDPRMVYTCAYFPTPQATLAEAQEAKLDLVCRKLGLAPGQRLLDLGCGWGALAMWAADRYGVEAHGVTLSPAQAGWAGAAIAQAGLTGRVRVECGDWRDLPQGGGFDAIAAVGLLEHVGRADYARFFGRVRSLLAPGGRFLNHCITNRPGTGWSDEMEFLDRHVFPGGELAPVGEIQSAMEGADFEIAHVESLRPHYARTTRAWAERLRAERSAARALVGERTYRTWLAYLAAASTAFEAGWIGLHQVVALPAHELQAEEHLHAREQEGRRAQPRMPASGPRIGRHAP